jgi:cobalt/nickel transport system ATP-binding protein
VELMRSWKAGTKTVITATHDLDTIEDIADRCYVLKDGGVAGVGDPTTILHDVALLERSRLLRRLHHVHRMPSTPHPHIHLHEND